MSQSTATASLNPGFLTVQQEASGFLGGYLVTNRWGRPLEFRLSTAVQPNRIQQILYGDTLKPYICGDLIGKALVDKTTTIAQMILTDCEAVLDLRQRVEMPVGFLQQVEAPATRPEGSLPAGSKGFVTWHPEFPQDKERLQEMLERMPGVDLTEPFSRIREAIGEARKLGVTGR